MCLVVFKRRGVGLTGGKGSSALALLSKLTSFLSEKF